MTHFAVQQAEILWLPKADEVEQLQDFFNASNSQSSSRLKKQDKRRLFLNACAVHKLRKYLCDLLGIEIDIKDAGLKANLNLEITDQGQKNQDSRSTNEEAESANSTDYLCSIVCDFRLEKSFENCFHVRKRGQSLINKYCMLPNNKQYVAETWLKLDLKPACEDHKMRSHEPDLKISSFALGNFSGLNTFVEHFCSSSKFPEGYNFRITEVNGKFVNDRKRFELYFVVKNINASEKGRNVFTHRLFKLELQYSQILRLLVCDSENFTIYFQYLTFPLLYGVSQDVGNDEFISFYDVTPATHWQRAINLCEGCPSELRYEFSMNTVLKIEFKQKDYFSLMQLLKFCKQHTETYFTPVTVVPARSNIQVLGINSSTYECFYALKCILTRSYEFVDQLVARNELRELNKFLQEANKEDSKALTEALYHIYDAIEKGSVLAFCPAIKVLFNKIAQKGENSDKKVFEHKRKSIYIKRAYLLPTHVRFCPPQLALRNRITNAGTSECFMRITVRDIDFQVLSFTVRSFGIGQKEFQKKFFEDHVKRPLVRGIKLGSCHYEYVGASSSQLKSHSLWLYTVDPEKPHVTAKTIRNDIGDLDKIVDVPKFMARLGLSFSQAMGRIPVPQKYTNFDNPESDIEGEQKIYLSDDSDDERDMKRKNKYMQGSMAENSCSEGSESDSGHDNMESNDETDDDEVEEFDPYIFSDGIGRMSSDIADEIYKEFSIVEERPSAVQIRYAGCKGMLVVDPTLEGRKIMFRKSMKKYGASDDSLEILKYSKPRNVYLNRHFIAILEEKGIPKETFVKLQKEMLHNLVLGMFYDEQTLLLLKSNCQMRLDYEGLFKTGFSFTEDPFFRSMMLAIFKKQLELLKDHARIKLPNDNGRNMFGVLDETRTLEYGEIFVQYTKWDSMETDILEGTVLVTKNPCMHPGDVRKFEAVDVPELRHIKDCIVFPAKGPRPHPDEMAGSDLDGDEYVVVWVEELIFDAPNSPAMDFATKKVKKPERDRPIEPTDELKHFCNFMINDNAGQLANAYLAWADEKGMVNDGIMHRKCLSLAKQYAKALDFAKTGVPAVMRHKLKKNSYPDFLGKKEGKSMYISKKALGILFRHCKNLEQGVEGTTVNMEYTCDNDLLYGSYKKYEASARKTFQEYSKNVSSLLKMYGLTSEGELFSGSLPNNPIMFTNTSMKYNTLDMLEYEVQWSCAKLRKEFFAEFGGHPKENEFTEDMLSKASAWYAVSYPGNSADSSPHFFGLPWIISNVLTVVKQRKKGKITVVGDNIMVKKSSYIERAIDENVRKNLPPIESVLEIESAEEYKFAILDVSHGILMKWVQSLNFIVFNRTQAEKCVDDIFESISQKLLTCSGEYIHQQLLTRERKKVTSPGYYVLETLLQIADLGTCLDANLSCCDAYQELGIFAWITLVKLACSINTQYLGLANTEARNYSVLPTTFVAKQEDMVDTFNIDITDRLMPICIHAEDSLIKFLVAESKVSEISLRTEGTTRKNFNKSKKKNSENGRRKNQNSSKNSKNCKFNSFEKDETDDKSTPEMIYSLRITAKGSHFCIEKLKEFVFGKSFEKRVSSDANIKAELKGTEIALKEYQAWGKGGPLPGEKEKSKSPSSPSSPSVLSI